ncbi:MAG: aerotolerance regulator BatC [Prevotella sp.]|nr:aerotolerance regulator BatC [Prevotella sp.]
MKVLSLFIFIFSLFISEAQADNRQARKYIRQGNSLYRQGKQHEATVSYFKAVNADSTDARAQYNLATSMFPENWKMVQKEQTDTMVQTLIKAAELEQNPLRRSKAFHNVGTIFQNAKEFKQAIEAYKNALRSNPNDDESRYNLVLCQRQLKDDDQNQNGDNGQNQEQEDKQQQDQQQQQQQQQQDQQQQQQQEPPMSKENAEQLLNAAMQEEKKTQEKMQQMQQGQRRQIEKNW